MTEPRKQDELTDHEYDGIQEYDNPTPGWWKWLFAASCVFAVGYLAFFHMSVVGWTLGESYEAAVAANLKRQFATIGQLQPDRATILEYSRRDDWLTIGRSVFATHCTSCHGKQAEGLVGPNLTDHHYKSVRDAADLATVISDGAANGAMPAWKQRLHPNELVLVSAYVAAIRGQNLAGPRPPEGEVIPAWSTDAAPPASH